MNGAGLVLTAQNRRFDGKSLELTFMKTYGHFCTQCMRIDYRHELRALELDFGVYEVHLEALIDLGEGDG